MPYGFLDAFDSPQLHAAQAANNVRRLWENFDGDRANDRFTQAEAEFIAARDSFYMASISPTGWPYVQHRGGPAGFIRLLDDKTLAFADFRGNRQYISLGNVAADGRVALILMDYPNKARLKILAHLAVRDLKAQPDLATRLALPGYKAVPERAFVLTLQAFDWNCAQHITPRFTVADIAPGILDLQAKVAELEAENLALKAEIAATPTT